MGIIANLLKKWSHLKTKLANDSDWVTVYQSTDEYSARIQKLKLEDHEIPAMLFDQRDSSYNAFGYIYLNVQKQDELEALKILKSEHE